MKDFRDTFYRKARLVAIKYYKRYENTYKSQSLDCDDLIQEASLTVYEVLSNPKYKDKPTEEIQMIINQAIRFKLQDILRKMKKQKKLYLKKLNIESSKIREKGSIFDFQDVEFYLTKREYKVLYNTFVEGKSLREVGKELDLSHEGVRKIIKTAEKKIEDIYNNLT